MKTIQLNTKTVRLYEGIHERPAERDTWANYYLLADMGIGSSMQAVDNHYAALTGLVLEGKTELIPQQVENMRLCHHAILTRYRPDHLAWACLVESVDGVPYTDLSEDALTGLVADLSADGLTAGLIEDTLEEIKKKCPPSWGYTSPTTAQDGPD